MTFKEYLEKNNLMDFTITKLDISGCYITDLKGIENFTNLSRLDCHNNLLTDIKEIEYLTDLVYLNCQHNQIIDFKPIYRLKKLIYYYSDITDNIEEARRLILPEIRKEKISDII